MYNSLLLFHRNKIRKASQKDIITFLEAIIEILFEYKQQLHHSRSLVSTYYSTYMRICPARPGGAPPQQVDRAAGGAHIHGSFRLRRATTHGTAG